MAVCTIKAAHLAYIDRTVVLKGLSGELQILCRDGA